MAWRRPGDRPLSEPMMVSIYVTQPQWFNTPSADILHNNNVIITPIWHKMTLFLRRVSAWLMPYTNGRNFAEDIFKLILLDESDQI